MDKNYNVQLKLNEFLLKNQEPSQNRIVLPFKRSLHNYTLKIKLKKLLCTFIDYDIYNNIDLLRLKLNFKPYYATDVIAKADLLINQNR